MLTTRPSNSRGVTDIGWLKSRHTFSFGEYHDPAHMNFRALRVINDDVVAPGMGFGTHPHRDMEIISIVLEGQLEHKDSMGHGEVLRPGEVQVMTAGRGIRHSEFNPSRTEPVHFLQLWIMPEARNLDPAYAQRAFAPEKRAGRWCRVAGRHGTEDDGALKINQDADLYLASVAAGSALALSLKPGRGAWLHVISGSIAIGPAKLAAGDAAALDASATIQASANAELLLIDLA